MVYWWGDDEGAAGDQFMRDLSNMSQASVPIMVSPVNGDSERNFSNYQARFAMPGWEDAQGPQNLYYSFNLGPAHIIALNTEALGYWSDQPLETVGQRMLNWLERDLAEANTAANRTSRPWIIVHQHRPTYSGWGAPEKDDKPQRYFETLMMEYGVDLIFAGHIHNQERTLPVYNGSWVPGEHPHQPYQNCRAPVYVVSGNPGNAEANNPFNEGFQSYTAWRSYTFG